MFLPLQHRIKHLLKKKRPALYIKVRKKNLIISKEVGGTFCCTCLNNAEWALERIV